MKVNLKSHINKKEYEILRLSEYDIETTLDIPADYFSVIIENPIDYTSGLGKYADLFNDNDEIKIYEQNKLILSGIADDVIESWGEDYAKIELSGRDTTLLLLENDAEPKSYYDMNLASFINTLASPLGFSVKVSSKYDRIAKKRVVEVGDSIWDALYRESKKLGLWIWCNHNKTIQVDKLNYKSTADYFFSNDLAKLDSKKNKYIPMKSLSKNKKGSQLKNEVWIRGHSNKAFTCKYKDSDLNNRGYSRRIITEDSDAKSISKANEIAKNMANERKKGSYEIEIVVNGKHLIDINKTAYIYDTKTKLDGVFFIVGIRSSKNHISGHTKTIRLRPLWEGL